MRLHAERAIQYLASCSLDDFLGNHFVQDAVIRCVEVIGEAARLVSDDTRRRKPEIPWPLIVGMRHVLAHDYGAVNLEKVYAVAKEHPPDLIRHLEPLIAELEQETEWSDEGE
jgi:uncharacterized protein with HEPN domain